jgi:hypothetical protein
MECSQPDQFLSKVVPLSDDEWLLRLHFSPEHFQDGLLTPSAISTSDLNDRGFSVDRESIVNTNTLQDRAIAQAIRNPEQRETPYISHFQCKPIRLIEYKNIVAFHVTESPTEDNPAHAHILSTQKLGKGELRKLRCLLLRELQSLIELDQYIDSQNTK